MKRGAFFVNTARGGIVDEEALFKLVRDGHITNVALDVFRTEPLPADSPLRTLDHAVLTPHMIGHTQESLRAMTRIAVENVEQVLLGAPPPYPARGR
jgi:D-3-phosphoglycerate dehydrogenase